MQRRKGLRLRGGSKWAAILIIAVVLIGFDLLVENASIVNLGIVVGLSMDRVRAWSSTDMAMALVSLRPITQP